MNKRTLHENAMRIFYNVLFVSLRMFALVFGRFFYTVVMSFFFIVIIFWLVLVLSSSRTHTHFSCYLFPSGFFGFFWISFLLDRHIHWSDIHTHICGVRMSCAVKIPHSCFHAHWHNQMEKSKTFPFLDQMFSVSVCVHPCVYFTYIKMSPQT